MQKTIKHIVRLALMSCILLAACKKDDEIAPPLRSELLCVVTDADAKVDQLVLDNGIRYSVAWQEIGANVKSAVLRCLCSYAVNEDNKTVTVYQMDKVSCYAPASADSFKIHPMDPLDVRSVYRTGQFVNLHLSLLTNGSREHAYDLCLDSITNDSSCIHCSFLFQHAKLDDESYHHDFYHSIPLNSNAYPCEFDSLIVYINTYDGMKRYGFKK